MMAQIGNTPRAGRYDGIKGGPGGFTYLFEDQSGTPVDGTSEQLRNLAPFTLRLVPPDALLEYALTDSGESVNQITAAMTASDHRGSADAIAKTLDTVTAMGTSGSQQTLFESFVAQGRARNSGGSSFQSALATAYTAADIALQLQVMLNAEPLVLLINPAEMTVTHTKIQSYQSKTRYGYVFEAWGEDQPSISFSGSTAGFVAGSIGEPPSVNGMITNSKSVSGYREAARRDSAAWQNFAALYLFYRNNGYIYDTIGQSEAHLFIGSVAIDFDQWTYIGHIENFSFKFDEGMPHRVEFDMEFKVSKMYDNAVSSVSVQQMSTSPTSLGAGNEWQPRKPVAVVASAQEQSSPPIDSETDVGMS